VARAREGKGIEEGAETSRRGPGDRGHGGGARGEPWDDLRNEREESSGSAYATAWTTSTIVWTG
jgi:hypothetical protein